MTITKISQGYPKTGFMHPNHFYVYCQHYFENELDVIQFWVNAETISDATSIAYVYLKDADIEPVNIKMLEIALDN